jgi:hypothetical protein
MLALATSLVTAQDTTAANTEFDHCQPVSDYPALRAIATELHRTPIVGPNGFYVSTDKTTCHNVDITSDDFITTQPLLHAWFKASHDILSAPSKPLPARAAAARTKRSGVGRSVNSAGALNLLDERAYGCGQAYDYEGEACM